MKFEIKITATDGEFKRAVLIDNITTQGLRYIIENNPQAFLRMIDESVNRIRQSLEENRTSSSFFVGSIIIPRH